MLRLAFVTGGTGFIGRHLIDQLIANGWRVRVLARPTSDLGFVRAAGAEVLIGRLEEPATLASGVSSADTVFHLAGLTAARTEREYEQANAEGTRAVINAILSAEDRPRRLVYLS